MILHDITRGVFRSKVYPGDPKPEAKVIKSISNGDDCNLSKVAFCPHTGTHIDAPLHYFDEGKSIDRMDLNLFYGKCTVVTVAGILTGEDMEKILPKCNKRVLFKSDSVAYISQSGAQVLVDYGIKLVGTDSLSIAPPFDEEKTHRILLQNEVVIIECLDLSGVSDGEYEICAFPMKIEAVEASPCRAVLLQQEKGI
jgi:arylformamidase